MTLAAAMDKKRKSTESTLHQLQEGIKAKQEEVAQLQSTLSRVKEAESVFHVCETAKRIAQYKQELKYPHFHVYNP